MFDSKMLLDVFFLPNLSKLEIAALDARDINSWALPEDFVPGHSKVISLSLTAMVNANQLKQILSWPYSLQDFVYKYYHCDSTYHLENHLANDLSSDSRNGLQSLEMQDFIVALLPSRKTLQTLDIEVPNRCFGNADIIYNRQKLMTVMRCYHPQMNVIRFPVLRALKTPSFLLFELIMGGKNNSGLPALLSSSLRTLEIVLGEHDFPSSAYRPLWQALHESGSAYRYEWLMAIGKQCYAWGQLPILQRIKIAVQDVFYLDFIPLADDVYSQFLHQGVTLDLHFDPLDHRHDRDYWDDDRAYDEQIWNDYLCFGSYGLMFGKEKTEYTDSPRDSEFDEDHIDEFILEDERWEEFDNVMAEERAKVGLEWVGGQWPDYEESREERRGIFSWWENKLQV